MPTIKELRFAKGWTQSELSQRANVSPQVIVRMEKGISGRPISKTSLLLVCQALGVTPQQVEGVNVVNRVGKGSRARE